MRRLLWPTVSGVLYFLSWIGFGVWPLAFVCFVPLLFSLRDATPKQALRRGFWMGFVTHLGGYTWIMHLLRVFADAPWPLAFGGYLLLCAAQGLLYGVLALALHFLRERTRWPMAALLPVALVACEFAFPLLFQSYTGVALMPVLPLVQIADLGGVLLLSALQAMVNGALFDALVAWRTNSAAPTRSMVATLIALAASTGYGSWRLVQMDARQKAAPHLTVGLAQPNVGELELHQNPYASVRTLQDESAELSARGAQLVIWPEVGFNIRAIRSSETVAPDIGRGLPVSIIAGVARTAPGKFWNSALVVDAGGRVGDHYDKIQLLAFGEYIPFGDWFPIFYQWSPLSAPLSRGETTAPLRALGYRFATFICYEDILPAIVSATMSDHGREEPASPATGGAEQLEGRAHAMVNLTNDSWYGAGHEQEEHLMLAAVRSIEHRRWLLRDTSTGISAFVDATGRVVQRIDRNLRGVAVREVPMLQGTTPYEVLGPWPGWLSLAVFVWAAVRRRVRPLA
jgi:apolipoprotein N-acyltransferase